MSKSGLFHAYTLLLAISKEISPKYTPFQCAAGGACGWENRRNRARVGLSSVLVHGRVFLSIVGFGIFTQAEWTSNRSSYTDLLFTRTPHVPSPTQSCSSPTLLDWKGRFCKGIGARPRTLRMRGGHMSSNLSHKQHLEHSLRNP